MEGNHRSLSLIRLVIVSSCHLVIILSFGCGHAEKPGQPVRVEPQARLIQPERRTITHLVGQPGFIYAYEQTSIYPKVAGYVERWEVDIGDVIKKDQEIAQLYVPELEAELAQKKAQVDLDEAQIKVAERMVEVARNNVNAAGAQVEEARATAKKYQAGVERWQSEVKRLTEIAKQNVIDPQVLDESQKQLNENIAARDAAQATTAAADANRLARIADLDKARADVQAAHARAQVSQADEQRVAALVSYLHITAPYDGVVVVRNVNTKDFVQPGTGDQSNAGSASQSPPRLPLYVVARTDRVRIYVDVPEMDAAAITRGTPARVRVQALRDEEIEATVTRTSWSLRPESRTLRAEIDLPNPDARLRPGMYAYGRVLVDRHNVWAVPLAAVVEIGNQNCCYVYEAGKAVQTPVQVGLNDGKWIEVAKKRAKGEWTDLTGNEKVILGDLSELSDGQPVQVGSGSKKQSKRQGSASSDQPFAGLAEEIKEAVGYSLPLFFGTENHDRAFAVGIHARGIKIIPKVTHIVSEFDVMTGKMSGSQLVHHHYIAPEAVPGDAEDLVVMKGTGAVAPKKGAIALGKHDAQLALGCCDPFL